MADEKEKETSKAPAQVQGHCPKCGPRIWADVVAQHDVREGDDRSGVWRQSTYRMLKCGGCKTVYFQEVFVFSDDFYYDYNPETQQDEMQLHEQFTYWPAPSRRNKPDWLDRVNLEEELYNLLLETYKALDVDARVLAAIGARTVFDRAFELLEIDPAITFAEKLDALLVIGKIGLAECDHLDVLTDAGGAAAHRGWGPTTEQLSIVMSIVEAFIFRTFVLEEEVKRLRSEIAKATFA